MPQSLEERIAYLEGKVEEHTRGFGDLTTRIDGLSSRIDALDQKVDRFRTELSARIDALSARVDALSARMDRRFDVVDEKMSRHFIWLVGIQVAVMLSVIGALLR